MKRSNPLPQDMIIEILLRLPFESILECKRVSKQWKNLINDPKFSTRYHLNRSMAVFLHQNELYCIFIRHNKSITRFPPYTVHRIPIGLNISVDGCNNINYQSLSGWSNGIACVKGATGHFLFYNLLTGYSFRVTDAPLREHSYSWICYGFGYDAFADDHNILVVCHYDTSLVDWLEKYEGIRFDINTVQNGDTSLFWVYSFRNRSWKSFCGFPSAAASYDWSMATMGAYSFNGVLHWVAITRGNYRKRVIVTYGLHTRRFGEILAPNASSCVGVNLSELDGHLCYVNGHMKNVEVWVMEEYGVQSWIKLLSFAEYPRLSVWSLPFLAHTGLYECGDGGKVVLFVFHKQMHQPRLFWYDMNNNEISWTRIRQRKGRLLMSRPDQKRVARSASPPAHPSLRVWTRNM